MSTIEIKDWREVRAGDKVEFAFAGGTQVIGTALKGSIESELFVIIDPRDPTAGRHYLSSLNGQQTFVRATRTLPPLPTEPRSVILDVVTETGREYSIGVRDNAEWNLVDAQGEWGSLRSERIVSFTPAKVVSDA